MCRLGPGRPHLALQPPLASLLSPAAGHELSTVSHTLWDLHIRGDHRAAALTDTALSQDPCPPLSKGHSCFWTEEPDWTQMHRRFVCFPGKGGVSPGSATFPRTVSSQNGFPSAPRPCAKAGVQSAPSRPGHRAERCQLPLLYFSQTRDPVEEGLFVLFYVFFKNPNT